jgi:hypothetical protein
MELRSVMWHGCVACIERMRNASRIVMGKLREGNSLEDLDIDRRITLTLKEQDRMV